MGTFHLEKESRNFGANFREFLYGKKLFHFAANFAHVEVRVARRDTKMATELLLIMLDEPLVADEEEMTLIDSDDEEICVRAVTGSNRNNSTGKLLWKTTYTCPVPSVGICFIYVQF